MDGKMALLFMMMVSVPAISVVKVKGGAAEAEDIDFEHVKLLPLPEMTSRGARDDIKVTVDTKSLVAVAREARTARERKREEHHAREHDPHERQHAKRQERQHVRQEHKPVVRHAPSLDSVLHKDSHVRSSSAPNSVGKAKVSSAADLATQKVDARKMEFDSFEGQWWRKAQPPRAQPPSMPSSHRPPTAKHHRLSTHHTEQHHKAGTHISISPTATTHYQRHHTKSDAHTFSKANSVHTTAGGGRGGGGGGQAGGDKWSPQWQQRIDQAIHDPGGWSHTPLPPSQSHAPPGQPAYFRHPPASALSKTLHHHPQLSHPCHPPMTMSECTNLAATLAADFEQEEPTPPHMKTKPPSSPPHRAHTHPIPPHTHPHAHKTASKKHWDFKTNSYHTDRHVVAMTLKNATFHPVTKHVLLHKGTGKTKGKVHKYTAAAMHDLGKEDQAAEQDAAAEEKADKAPKEEEEDVPEYLAPPPQIGFPYVRWADDPDHSYRQSNKDGPEDKDLWYSYETNGEPTYPLRGMFGACDCEGTTKRKREMDYYSYYNEFYVRLRGCKQSNCVNCLHIVSQLDPNVPGRFLKCDESCEDRHTGPLEDEYMYIHTVEGSTELPPGERAKCPDQTEADEDGLCEMTCDSCDTCVGTSACEIDEVKEACPKSCDACPCNLVNGKEACVGPEMAGLDMGKCVMLANEVVEFTKELGETYSYQTKFQDAIMQEEKPMDTELNDERDKAEMLEAIEGEDKEEIFEEKMEVAEQEVDLMLQMIVDDPDSLESEKDKARKIITARENILVRGSNVQVRAGNVVCQQMGCCTDD